MTEEQERMRREFGEQLLKRTSGRNDLPLCFSSSPDNAFDAPSGKDGVHYSLMFRQRQTEVVLYLDCGNKDLNKRRFDYLIIP